MRTGKTKLGVDIKSTHGLRVVPSEVLWVLVANNAGARIFERKHGTGELTQIRAIDHPVGRQSGNSLVSDHPGRSFDSHSQSHGGHQTGGARHALASPEDPKAHASDLWAAELARSLDAGLAEFNRVVLIVGPQLAGRINGHLTATVKKRVERIVEKDLSHLSAANLHERVTAIVMKTE